VLNIEKLPNGNLSLSIPNQEDRQEIADQLQRGLRESEIWPDLLEPYSCNGSYTPVSPEVYSVGLTSDPYILVEDLTIEDDGSATVAGGHWHYPFYMIKSVIEQLRDGETVELVLWHTAETTETLERL
jgi:hypothetical protein